MKKSTNAKMAAVGLAVLSLLAVIVAACSMPETYSLTTGVSFSLGAGGQRAAGNLSAPAPIAAVVVSIEKSDGTPVCDLRRLTLVNMNGAYISEKLYLTPGAYRLTAFFVTDAAGNALFATPLDGSPLAGNVNDPLPIEFSVQQGIITPVVPQVVSTDGQEPEKFGYVTFKFEIVGGTYPRLTIKRHYVNPGPDGLWFTADDVMGGYNLVDYKSYGSSNTDKWCWNPGDDGAWLTDDDIPDGWWWNRFANGGSSHQGPGSDGIWYTQDDQIRDWADWGTMPGIEIIRNQPGPDGVWFTGDDVVSAYEKKTLDAQGNEIQRIHYDGPGPDGIWFNEDDRIGSNWLGCYVAWTYSGEGNYWGSWDRQVVYKGPGADNAWFTADDEIRDYAVHDFADGNKYFTKETVYAAGPDGVFFTADDVAVRYSAVENQY